MSGTPEAEQTRFQRNLEDHLQAQGLVSQFTQLMGTVWNDSTDLTLAHQCNLLSWLHAQPYLTAAVVSELKPVDDIEDVEGPQLRMDVFSVAAIAGCLLYRLGRLSPDAFAQVLGGFVVPHFAS